MDQKPDQTTSAEVKHYASSFVWEIKNINGKSKEFTKKFNSIF
jgi:hypothetical protein